MQNLRLFALLFCSTSLFAAATAITDNASSISNVTNDPVTVISVVVPVGFTAADSTVVSSGTTLVSLSSAGAFTVNLHPNATTTGIYTFTYKGSSGATYTENLSVPVSGSAIALAGARSFGSLLASSTGLAYMMPGATAAPASSGIATYGGAGSPASVACTVNTYTTYQGNLYGCPSSTLIWTAISGGSSSVSYAGVTSGTMPSGTTQTVGAGAAIAPNGGTVTANAASITNGTCPAQNYTAGGTITQYQVVVLSGGTVTAALTSATSGYGIAQANATTGNPVPVCSTGYSNVIADATLT